MKESIKWWKTVDIWNMKYDTSNNVSQAKQGESKQAKQKTARKQARYEWVSESVHSAECRVVIDGATMTASNEQKQERQSHHRWSMSEAVKSE